MAVWRAKINALTVCRCALFVMAELALVTCQGAMLVQVGRTSRAVTTAEWAKANTRRGKRKETET